MEISEFKIYVGGSVFGRTFKDLKNFSKVMK